ncbi:MAG: gamma-glutamyl-gamma-aminobutyrate hydrolase family protein [Pseudobdellovibrionaceae bacterium]
MRILCNKPLVGILCDENTTSGGTAYDVPKNLPGMLSSKGAIPVMLPYENASTQWAKDNCSGLVIMGGRTAFPDEWHVGNATSIEPYSERIEHEKELLEHFITADKPVLGLCYGMQFLGCYYGCKLVPNLREAFPDALPHKVDAGVKIKNTKHFVTLHPGSLIANVTGRTEMEVSSRHNTCLGIVSPIFRVAAKSEDGITEAIEMRGHRFAVGVQWHQEDDYANADHPGNRIFDGFIAACS